MATTTEPLLQITDGVSSVMLMDNTLTTTPQKLSMPYRLSYDTWAPKVAQRNKNPFGLPYMPVMEEMTIDIKGVTPDDAMSKLQTLNTLLDQGERWFNNEIVNPVFVRYQPKGSTKSTYMSDVIIGRGHGDNTDLLDLPSNFELVGSYYWIKGIRVRFWRRNGVWLCESEAQSVATVDVGNSVALVTWADFANVLSPVQLELYPTNVAVAVGICSGFILVTHNDFNYQFVEGASGVTAVSLNGPVSTNDAGKFPTNGKIGRVTTSTVQVDATITPVLMQIENCEYCSVYANVRNNDATNDVYLQVSINPGKTTILPDVKIAAAATPTPAWVFLGMFPTRGRRPTQINISYRSSAGTPTFDFDSVVLHGVNRASNALAVTFDVQSPAAGVPLAILHRMLNEPQGELAIRLPPNDTLQPYTGSIYCFTGAHGTIKKTAVAVLLTDRTNWQVSNSAGTAGATWNLTATRLKAYLVPE
jgi:hypothetical protein